MGKTLKFKKSKMLDSDRDNDGSMFDKNIGNVGNKQFSIVSVSKKSAGVKG